MVHKTSYAILHTRNLFVAMLPRLLDEGCDYSFPDGFLEYRELRTSNWSRGPSDTMYLRIPALDSSLYQIAETDVGVETLGSHEGAAKA